MPRMRTALDDGHAPEVDPLARLRRADTAEDRRVPVVSLRSTTG